MPPTTLPNSALTALQAGLPDRFPHAALESLPVLTLAIDWWLDHQGTPEAWVDHGGFDPIIPDEYGYPLLLVACDLALVDAVERLLAAGANPNRASLEDALPLLQLDAASRQPRPGPVIFTEFTPPLDDLSPEAETERATRFQTNAQRCIELLLAHSAHDMLSLRDALLTSDLATARALLAAGASARGRVQRFYRYPALIDLCLQKNLPESVRLLVEFGARISPNTLGYLVEAQAYACTEPLLPAVLQAGLPNTFNQRALHESDLIDPAVHWWLAHGGSPDAQVVDSLDSVQPTRLDRPLLLYVCDTARPHAVERLLRAGANPNCLSASATSPLLQLHENLNHAERQAPNLTFGSIPPVEKMNEEAEAARAKAYVQDAQKCVELLLAHGALDLRQLHAAVAANDLPALRTCLAAGMSPLARAASYEARSPLELAISHDHPEACRILLEYGVVPSIEDLIFAGETNSSACIAPLLEHGAARRLHRDPTQVVLPAHRFEILNRFFTAFRHDRTTPELVDQLLAGGFEPAWDHPDLVYPPLIFACDHLPLWIAKLGLDPLAPSASGSSLLHGTLYRGWCYIAEALLDLAAPGQDLHARIDLRTLQGQNDGVAVGYGLKLRVSPLLLAVQGACCPINTSGFAVIVRLLELGYSPLEAISPVSAEVLARWLDECPRQKLDEQEMLVPAGVARCREGAREYYEEMLCLTPLSLAQTEKNAYTGLLLHLLTNPLPHTEREWLLSLYDHLQRKILSKPVDELFTPPSRMILSIQSAQSVELVHFDQATAWFGERFNHTDIPCDIGERSLAVARGDFGDTPSLKDGANLGFLLALASSPKSHFDEGKFLAAVSNGLRQLQAWFELHLAGC